MEYAFVKKAKVGDLAEGENPMHTIRVDATEVENYLTPAQESDEKWELATEEEWDAQNEGQNNDQDEVDNANAEEAAVEEAAAINEALEAPLEGLTGDAEVTMVANPDSEPDLV